MTRRIFLAGALLVFFALVGVACSNKDTSDSRQDFENKSQQQLDKVDKRINDLENQVKSSNADDDAKRELSSLKDEREKVSAKLNQARSASDDDWQRIKGDLNQSLDKLNDQVETFSNRLKDKFKSNQGGGQ